MGLFIREHLSLVIFQCLQSILIPVIFLLDGYHDAATVGYAIFVSFFLLGCYLVYRYASRRQFYRKLTNPMKELDESLEEVENAPVSAALIRLLRSQYGLYQDELQTARDLQEDHLMFMDRWVHQMKTPLSVIQLTAQNLDEPESSSIREETDRMRNGLNTVLYMARLRTIAEDFHIKPVRLSELVHEVNQENKRFYIRNNVFPQLKKETQEMVVETDEKWLFFIISQFVHNAVKYSAGKSNQIIISIDDRAGEAVLEVKDFGVGIPAVDLKRVFHKFYTGENGRKYRESTGMGLYLVKEVAGKLDHRLELDSSQGEGTSIRIIFSNTQNITEM